MKGKSQYIKTNCPWFDLSLVKYFLTDNDEIVRIRNIGVGIVLCPCSEKRTYEKRKKFFEKILNDKIS